MGAGVRQVDRGYCSGAAMHFLHLLLPCGEPGGCAMCTSVVKSRWLRTHPGLNRVRFGKSRGVHSHLIPAPPPSLLPAIASPYPPRTQTFAAHRIVLATSSSKLFGQLIAESSVDSAGGAIASQGESLRLIELEPVVTSAAFAVVLEFMYCGFAELSDEALLPQVRDASQHLQVTPLLNAAAGALSDPRVNRRLSRLHDAKSLMSQLVSSDGLGSCGPPSEGGLSTASASTAGLSAASSSAASRLSVRQAMKTACHTARVPPTPPCS